MGLLATVADLLVYEALVVLLAVAPRAARVPGLLVGVALQFSGNKWLAFGDRSRRFSTQVPAFLAVEGLQVLANYLLFVAVVEWTPVSHHLALLLTPTVVYLGLSLPLWSLIFRSPDDAPAAASVEEGPG